MVRLVELSFLLLSSHAFSEARQARRSTNASDCVGVKAIAPGCESKETLAQRDYFYIGGHYVNSVIGNLTYDQVYVEKITPVLVYQPKPVVFFHGGGVSGATWLNTPDNRKGFASHFLDNGYQVYIIDQTSVGRASEEDLTDFVMRIGSTAEISEEGFTAPQIANTYPQSQNHTQWPGTGLRGDPVFDSFESNFIPLTSNWTAQELSMRASGCALLGLIGPSFLISHSIGALHPITLSNDCPALVAGNINIEPDTVPFEDYTSTVFPNRAATRPWGLTNTHLTYSPAISNYTELNTVTVGNDTIALRSCIQQAEPARTLPEIAKVPYVALTGSASPHMTYDQCIINYLKQAGVAAEWIKMGDIGIYGNAHFGYLERNSIEYFKVIHDWIQSKI